MATQVAHLVAKLSAQTRDFDRAMGKSQTKMGKFASVAKKGLGAAAVGLGALGAVSVRNAGNLEEQINKTSVVFRGSEETILKWARGTGQSIGISNRAALEAAGTFGNMLVPMGIARKEAGGMSTRMVELAADMASFNNASPEDTLEALASGLAGETEPLRKFGVFLNDARLKEEALRLGLYKGKGQLDANAKATATYSLILKDSKDAQGDFERTSGSMANQQRLLKAQFEDVTAELGKELIPVVVKVLEVTLRFVKWLQGVNGGERIKKVWKDVTDFTSRQWERTVEIWETVKRTFTRFGVEMKRQAWILVRDIVEPFSHLPGRMGKWARDAKDRANEELGKIERKIKDLRLEARKASAKPYVITFHTNAAAVAEHINLAARRFRESTGDFGSGGFGKTSLVALGRQLQSMGFHVGEHPQFGGVSGGHVPGSYHYQGRALDINWPGGGGAEMAKLDWLNSRLRSMPGVKELLWRTAGHFDHLHVAMDRGGVVPGRRGAPVPVLAHGGETFIPTHRAGVSAGNVYNFNGPVLNGEALLRYIQQQSKVSGRRGGPSLNFGGA